MEIDSHRPRGAILPAPACDLLDRLTSQLGIAFTLTDLHGAVVASTGGRAAGSLLFHALPVLESGQPHAVPATHDAPSAEAGVYVPLRLAGRIAGVLVAHGDPEEIRTTGHVAAISIGLALDFSEAASLLGRENISSDWLLYRLLKGSRADAQHARVVAAIYGWNLFVQRVAIVITAAGAVEDQWREAAEGASHLVARLMGPSGQTTPFGQVDDAQWLILVQQEPKQSRTRIRELAESLRQHFRDAAQEVYAGIGEPHLPISPILALRRSYREAVYASRLGPKFNGRTRVYELRSLGAAAFFAPSSPSRRKLAELALEPLREHPPVMETLQSFLASDLSIGDTAKTLGMHRHTVRNHLDRVYALTGFNPRSLEGAVQLKLALLVAAADSGSIDNL